MSRAVISGVAAVPVGRRLEKSIRDTAADLAFAALADAGVEAREVDGLYATPPALNGMSGFMWSCSLAHHLGLATRGQAMVECGGLTAALALKLAAQEVERGRLRCCLVLATDVRATEQIEDFEFFMRSLTSELVGLYGPYDALYGLAAPIPYYAMSAQRYLHEYGLTREDLAPVAVALRRHAQANERAQLRKPITVEDVLAAPVVCPPLGLLDCSAFASGGAAVVVTEESIARASGHGGAALRSIGEAHEPAHFAPLRGSLTQFDSAIRASKEAYDSGGVKPADIAVAEVYGVFSATELMLYEDLGFFAKGQAARAVREGRTAGQGSTVFNPSGGRLSLGHPAGATPLYSVVEIVEQLRGMSGSRQVKNAQLGLVHAEHGMLNGSLVAILEAA